MLGAADRQAAAQRREDGRLRRNVLGRQRRSSGSRASRTPSRATTSRSSPARKTTRTAKARSNVEDVINAYPDMNLLCGLWSYNGPAIAAAVDASGKKGKIQVAVFDEEDGTLDGIENGTIACTVVQKPFQFGYLSSKYLHDLATQGRGRAAAGRTWSTPASGDRRRRT